MCKNKKFFEDYFKNGVNSLPFNWDFDKLTDSIKNQIRSDYRVTTTENGIYIECEVPGFSKSDISLSLDDNHLIIVAENEKHISKTFRFRVESNPNDEITATCENGLLSISIEHPIRTNQKKTIVVE